MLHIGFGSLRIRTIVSMAPNNSNRVIMGSLVSTLQLLYILLDLLHSCN